MARAEIPGQQDTPGLPLHRLFCRGEGPVFLQKDGGIGQAKTVDGLLDVPHQKQLVPATGHRVKNRVLHLIGVLILVHHHLVVSRAPQRGQFRAGAVLHQQPHRHVLQIGKVQHAPAVLLGPIGGGEVLHQSK